MNAKLNMQTVPLSWLRPAEYNPRENLKPGDPEYEDIRASIDSFDYVSPIIANKDGTIIGGHQRFTVLKDLGYTEADVVIVDKTKDEEAALNVALNKISGRWDPVKLAQLIGRIDTSGLDATLTGFDSSEIKKMVGAINTDWFRDRERNDTSRQEGNDAYNSFLDKFEPPKTTDDCYTPDNIYEVIADWVADEFGADRHAFVRPFYPGGDYQNAEYQENEIVVDNPPFSILAQIIRFYCENGVKFFLFAPSLTIITAIDCDVTYIAAGANITYENGATVSTGFVTNLDSLFRFRTAPSLYAAIKVENDRNLRENTPELPVYVYPDHVVIPSVAMKWGKYGQDFRVRKDDCVIISELDCQKEKGKAIYGKGLLLSERAAAEKAAAEKAAAEKAAAEKAAAERWTLSERELEIVRELGGDRSG